MSQDTLARRPSVGTRRVGYLVAAGINIALLYLINVRPGWEAVPFLTDATPRVLGPVNVSLAVGIAFNLAYLWYGPPWFTSFGEVVTTIVGLVVLVRLWQVFPFSFHGAVDWALVIRWILGFAIAVSVIALLVQLVRLVTRIVHAGAGLPHA